jgi:regulator of protease activity HflC (stomatin/prohibitin superfamily)
MSRSVSAGSSRPVERTTVPAVPGARCRSRRDNGSTAQTETLNESIKEILDVTTKKWGVLVEIVELKDLS